MQAEDYELDALLLAQSSDEEGNSDISELERNILDQIIDSTDLNNDVPFSTILASFEGLNASLLGSQASFGHESVTNGGISGLDASPHLHSLEMSSLVEDSCSANFVETRSKDYSSLESVAVERGHVLLDSDEMSRSPKLVLESEGQVAGVRIMSRPGAALAAAAAVSRQMASSPSTMLRSRRTKSVDIRMPALSSRKQPDLNLASGEIIKSRELFLSDIPAKPSELQEVPSSLGGTRDSSLTQSVDGCINLTNDYPLSEPSLTASTTVHGVMICSDADENFQSNDTSSLVHETENELVTENSSYQEQGHTIDDIVSQLHEEIIDNFHSKDAVQIVKNLGEFHDVGGGSETEHMMIGQKSEFIHEKSKELSESPYVRVDQEDKNNQHTALDRAEEYEKMVTKAGACLEEDAAAQTSSLDFIKQGQSRTGILHVDSTGSLSQALGSTAMRRDFGFTQALAVHANFIAVGMSKGAVLVTPSKYSPTRAIDDADAKAALLEPPDKAQMAVTVMCFSDHGDHLLVGYAGGTISLWDVPRVKLNMSIVDQHAGAIVHAFFLLQADTEMRQMRAVTADCKGRVLLHTFTFRPLLRRFSVLSQIVDIEQDMGSVLAISPLNVEDLTHSTANMNSANKSTDAGHKFLFNEVGSVEPTEPARCGIVVIVTRSAIFAASLIPTYARFATLHRPARLREGAIPYTSWQHSRKTYAEVGYDTVDNDPNWPVLAVAWDRRVIIAHLNLKISELIVDVEWDIDNAAAGIAWLEDKVLVVATVKGQLLVYKKDGTEIERATLKDVQGNVGALMYHTHFVNEFENPEKAFHNTIGVRGAALYLLGPSQLWRARLLPWFDRLKLLKGSGDWMEAFRFALELFDGKAESVTGLPRRLEAMRHAIRDTLLGLLFSYLDEVFAYLALGSSSAVFDSNPIPAETESGEAVESPTGIETWGRANLGLKMIAEPHEHYAKIGRMSIEFCVHIGKTEVICEDIYSRFESVGQKSTFLELLEPYILRDMLSGLAPEVMQAFVDHYSHCGWLERVEECVLHMTISSLDFNQVIKLCRKHGLYTALIYLFNSGLDDFTSPLEELLIAAQSPSSRIEPRTLGYKMLVYLKACFNGLAFPLGRGTLPIDRLPTLRAELLQFLLDVRPTLAEIVDSSCNAKGCAYPRLGYLLKLDTQATLVVLRSAFPVHGVLSIGRQGWAYADAAEASIIDYRESSDLPNNFQVIDEGVRYLQAVVIAMTQNLDLRAYDSSKILDSDSQNWLSADDQGVILEFVAEYVASRHVVVGRTTLKCILEYVTSPIAEKVMGKSTRQNLLIKLLKSVPESDWDFDHSLLCAQRAGLWQASAWLHVKYGSSVAALDCYLQDKYVHEPVFSYVMQKLDATTGLKGGVLAEFRKAVLDRICKLMLHSSKGTLWIVLTHFSTSNEQVMEALESDETLLFAFLKDLMNAIWGVPTSFVVSGGVRSSSCLQDVKSKVHNEGNRDKFSSRWEFLIKLDKLVRRSGFQCTDKMVEQYLQLLCRLEPESVVEFLARCEQYNVDNCLRMVQKYGIADAAILLLERAGDISGALALLIKDLDSSLQIMLQSLISEKSDRFNMEMHSFYSMSETSAVESALHAGVALCLRNTQRLSSEEACSLWFRLLDSVVEALRNLTPAFLEGTTVGLSTASSDVIGERVHSVQYKMMDDNKYKLVRMWLVHLVGSTVTAMQDHVSPQILLQQIISNYGSHPLGDFRAAICNLLSAYTYEFTILGKAKQLVEESLHHSLYMLLRGSTHAYALSNSKCCICKLELVGVHSSNMNELIGVSSSSQSTSTSEVCSDGLQVLTCGHAAHAFCISGQLGGGGKRSLLCPLCCRNLKFLASEEKISSIQDTQSQSSTDIRPRMQLLWKNKDQEISSIASTNKSRLQILNELRDGKGVQMFGPRLHLSVAPPKKPKGSHSQFDKNGFGQKTYMHRVSVGL